MIWFLLACSSDWSPDSSPIQVEAWAPTIDAPGSVDQALHLRLNARIDSASLEYVLLLDAQGEPVAASAFADSVLPTLTITPDQLLEPDSTYTVLLEVGLSGRSGQLLQGPVEIEFATLALSEQPADSGE